MTVTEMTSTTVPELVTFDLYRDIHKGIRSELFAVTEAAGRLDPTSAEARRAMSDHVRSVVAALDEHAEHEDVAIAPTLEARLPDLAERVASEHRILERRAESMLDLARSAVDARAQDQRRLTHHLYRTLAAFTGTYLGHQDFEERELMPALERAAGVDAVIDIHRAILSSIRPEDMTRTLAFMLPAMNVDDRSEMLGGMRADAPPEVFDGVWSLARSVLGDRDVAALASRLGIA